MALIEETLCDFIADLVKREEIDLIVCAERKATAILRALIEATQTLQWDWSRVLSTAVMHQFDWDSFEGRRVLLFDELVHHGKTLGRYRDRLCELVPEGVEVLTAGYAVWDRCQSQPDFYYHGSVDSETYEHIRDELVLMLQQHGSLLLDTEHIELSVRLHCGVREFYDTLARTAENGNSYSFLSGAGRTNITIERPDIASAEGLARCLTPGSNINQTVCKVRVLERTHERFSVLPILYPNTRCVPTAEWLKSLPSFVDRTHLANAPQDENLYKELFYLVGLLGSAELLRSVAAALGELAREQKIILEVPKENFLHLKAMFPRLNILGFWEYVRNLVDESRRSKAARGKQSAKAGHLPESVLVKLTGRVLARLVMEGEDSPDGKSWGQLMRFAEEENRGIGIDSRALSMVADRLIDSGLIVTSTKVMQSSSGEPFVVRTFAPEGEVITAKVRQQLLVRTPECLLVT